MNYSAVVIPVTKEDKDIDLYDELYEPLGDKDRVNWRSCEFVITFKMNNHHSLFKVNGKPTNRSPDDPEIYHGGPVGVQIVGRKFEEEKVLALGKIIYAAVQSSECA